MEAQKKPKSPWKPKRSKYDIELEPWEQKIAEAIYAGKPLLGEGGAFTDMIKRVVQASLKGTSKNLERMARMSIVRPDKTRRRADTGTKYPTEEQRSMAEREACARGVGQPYG